MIEFFSDVNLVLGPEVLQYEEDNQPDHHEADADEAGNWPERQFKFDQSKYCLLRLFNNVLIDLFGPFCNVVPRVKLLHSLVDFCAVD